MLVYRVFPFYEDALPGEPGHLEYLHKPQGQGRLTTRSLYDTWYFAATPEAQVGEVFGDITTWGDDMFEFPALPNALRVLGIFELPDATNLLDLDDPRALYERRLRPTLKSLPAAVRSPRFGRWTSSRRPRTPVPAVGPAFSGGHSNARTGPSTGLWYSRGEAPIHKLVDWDFLDVNHSAVLDAARSLGKTFI